MANEKSPPTQQQTIIVFINDEQQQQDNVENTKKINGKFLVGWLNKLFINFPFCSIQ